MRGSLQGKVGLVTGGAGGIGQAIARALAGAGARVVLAGRDEAALRAVEIPGGAAMVVLLDVRDDAAWGRAIATVLRELGRLDVLVHNAGILEVGPLESRTVEAIRAIVETNLTGALLGTRAALPALRESRGAVVHLASLGGIVPMPFEAAYAATKAGIRHLSFSLRAELDGGGVTVSRGESRLGGHRAARAGAPPRPGVALLREPAAASGRGGARGAPGAPRGRPGGARAGRRRTRGPDSPPPSRGCSSGCCPSCAGRGRGGWRGCASIGPRAGKPRRRPPDAAAFGRAPLRRSIGPVAARLALRTGGPACMGSLAVVTVNPPWVYIRPIVPPAPDPQESSRLPLRHGPPKA